MSPDLLHRIQKVYPNGTICSLDENALKDVGRDQRIRTALDFVTKERDLLYDVQPFDNLPTTLASRRQATLNSEHGCGQWTM